MPREIIKYLSIVIDDRRSHLCPRYRALLDLAIALPPPKDPIWRYVGMDYCLSQIDTMFLFDGSANPKGIELC